MDPITAATHLDPYPYYASLRAAGGLRFDPGLGLWIASSAEAVCAALHHPACHVRPAHEPVPTAIADGAAGRVFGQLMRMNEGERQRCPRTAIAPGLQDIGPRQIEALVRARFLKDGAEGLHQAQFIGPVAVVATLLGFSPADSRLISELTGHFVACLSPLSNPAQRHAAHGAAERLTELFGEHLQAGAAGSPLLQSILANAASLTPDSLTANLIGLLSQTFEATAGLIGNAVLAILRDPSLAQRLRDNPAWIEPFFAEIQRLDPPVQNTRRFVAAPCELLGTRLEVGDVILVLLASANRDPQLNPQPDELSLERTGRRSFSFGSGRHECPGQALALGIAGATLGVILGRRLGLEGLGWGYRPSLNGRVPVFRESRAGSLPQDEHTRRPTRPAVRLPRAGF